MSFRKIVLSTLGLFTTIGVMVVFVGFDARVQKTEGGVQTKVESQDVVQTDADLIMRLHKITNHRYEDGGGPLNGATLSFDCPRLVSDGNWKAGDWLNFYGVKTGFSLTVRDVRIPLRQVTLARAEIGAWADLKELFVGSVDVRSAKISNLLVRKCQVIDLDISDAEIDVLDIRGTTFAKDGCINLAVAKPMKYIILDRKQVADGRIREAAPTTPFVVLEYDQGR